MSGSLHYSWKLTISETTPSHGLTSPWQYLTSIQTSLNTIKICPSEVQIEATKFSLMGMIFGMWMRRASQCPGVIRGELVSVACAVNALGNVMPPSSFHVKDTKTTSCVMDHQTVLGVVMSLDGCRRRISSSFWNILSGIQRSVLRRRCCCGHPQF